MQVGLLKEMLKDILGKVTAKGEDLCKLEQEIGAIGNAIDIVGSKFDMHKDLLGKLEKTRLNTQDTERGAISTSVNSTCQSKIGISYQYNQQKRQLAWLICRQPTNPKKNTKASRGIALLNRVSLPIEVGVRLLWRSARVKSQHSQEQASFRARHVEDPRRDDGSKSAWKAKPVSLRCANPIEQKRRLCRCKQLFCLPTDGRLAVVVRPIKVGKIGNNGPRWQKKTCNFGQVIGDSVPKRTMAAHTLCFVQRSEGIDGNKGKTIAVDEPHQLVATLSLLYLCFS